MWFRYHPLDNHMFALEVLMLVLSRKEGQTIEFPELDIVVRVMAVKRCRVQLGVEAPQQITVHRGEKVRELQERGHLPERLEPYETPGLSSEEIQRVLDELVRLETVVSTVVELAEPSNRGKAQLMAAEAMEKIDEISRSVRVGLRRRAVQPIADLVRIRTEVLNRLRARKEDPQPAECCD